MSWIKEGGDNMYIGGEGASRLGWEYISDICRALAGVCLCTFELYWRNSGGMPPPEPRKQLINLNMNALLYPMT